MYLKKFCNKIGLQFLINIEIKKFLIIIVNLIFILKNRCKFYFREKQSWYLMWSFHTYIHLIYLAYSLLLNHCFVYFFRHSEISFSFSLISLSSFFLPSFFLACLFSLIWLHCRNIISSKSTSGFYFSL